jgi:hypothetical protein
MNWKRGLFRVWIAASVCWALVVGVRAAMSIPSGMVVKSEVAGTAQYYACVNTEKSKGKEGNPYECEMGGGAPHEVTSTTPYSPYGLAKVAAPWLLEMIMGPLAVLALWFATFWIVAGFRQPPKNSN